MSVPPTDTHAHTHMRRLSHTLAVTADRGVGKGPVLSGEEGLVLLAHWPAAPPPALRRAVFELSGLQRKQTLQPKGVRAQDLPLARSLARSQHPQKRDPPETGTWTWTWTPNPDRGLGKTPTPPRPPPNPTRGHPRSPPGGLSDRRTPPLALLSFFFPVAFSFVPSSRGLKRKKRQALPFPFPPRPAMRLWRT